MYRFADITRFSKQEIDDLWKNARRVIKHPSIHILKAPQQTKQGRMLIVISRKVGTAPERNLLRRRLKSIFYEEKMFDRGVNIIAIARPGAPELSFELLKELLSQAIAQPTPSAP